MNWPTTTLARADPLQPEKRLRVEFGHAKLAQYGVGEHPQRDKEQNEANKNRLPDNTTDVFEDPLRAADLLPFTLVELWNGHDNSGCSGRVRIRMACPGHPLATPAERQV